jgi:hypothetical protein
MIRSFITNKPLIFYSIDLPLPNQPVLNMGRSMAP